MIWIYGYLAASFALSLFTCLWGKKLYFLQLGLGAFLSAFLLCAGQFGQGAVGLLAALAVGLVAGILAKVFYKLGAFLLGMAGGAALGLLLAALLKPSGELVRLLLIAGPALTAAVCAVAWSETFLMLSTAYSGAAGMALPVCALVLEFSALPDFVRTDGAMAVQTLQKHLTEEFLPQHSLLLLLVSLPPAIFGYCYQRRHDHSGRRRDRSGR